ncbi:hypothetical protein [Leptospira alstonii]|uniref:Lipoprotein n=2 Tax=Leptospira alstonii TaxID=28452 RepID=T0H4H3_9LEPT|nr:hypothetical protein [Leptospira alstonii]EMJ96611.1 putative lipoprotein [Leptospira alstonii serovar Sichuan str. 79601]EQA78678.1 putative lipoprotein [Leptospira alstonii serovar Pingchang str. 80-412]
MNRLISIFLIFSFVSCASYSEQVKQNEIDLDRVGQIVLASNDIPKGDIEFVKKTLSKTKKLLDKGVSESALADKWRDWVFDKWLFVFLFVLGAITFFVWKLKSFSISFPSLGKSGGVENAG